MVKVKKRKPSKGWWETHDKVQYRGGEHRTVCVALNPDFVELRLKGTRRSVTVPWGHIYVEGLKAKIVAEKPVRRRPVRRGRLR